MTDPSCLYDADVNRWFHVVLTLETKRTTGDFTGKNHLDLAVSDSPDPTGTWTIYRIPVQDDGTQGTPDHHCPLRNNGPVTARASATTRTSAPTPTASTSRRTSTRSSRTDIFHAAQIYAFSKQALAATPKNLTMQQFDTKGMGFNGQPGFTVWPAIATAGLVVAGQRRDRVLPVVRRCARRPAACPAAEQHPRPGLVADRHQHARARTEPDLDLDRKIVQVGRYSVPPALRTEAGSDARCASASTTPSGRRRRARAAGACSSREEPAHDEVLSPLDSNDSRMQQVWYADGKLFGALDTGVKISGDSLAGINWFVDRPGRRARSSARASSPVRT